MQEKVRFYADYRIKQHAPLRLLQTRLFFLISLIIFVITPIMQS